MSGRAGEHADEQSLHEATLHSFNPSINLSINQVPRPINHQVPSQDPRCAERHTINRRIYPHADPHTRTVLGLCYVNQVCIYCRYSLYTLDYSGIYPAKTNITNRYTRDTTQQYEYIPFQIHRSVMFPYEAYRITRTRK